MKLGISFSIIALSVAGCVPAADLQLTASQWKQFCPKNVRFEATDQSVQQENSAGILRVLELDPDAKYKLSF